MTDRIGRALGVILILIVAAYVVSVHAGCAPSVAQKSVVADSTYEADQLRCVAKAKTRAESQACRADAREEWHVDGGAR